MKSIFTQSKKYSLNKFATKFFLLAFLILLLSGKANAAARFAVTSGSWNGAIWATTSGGAAGSAATPTSADDVTINTGTITVTVTATANCNSLTVGTNATSTSTVNINSGISLTVVGAVNIPRPATGFNTIGVGDGSMSSASIDFSSNAGGAVRHSLTIAGGTVTVSGNIIGTGGSGSPTITFSAAGLLKVGGSIFTNAQGALNTATGCTVEYNGAGAQTVGDFTYENLTLSNAGSKTTTTVTVNDVLSMQGTATASVAPTYGAAATLQYNTSTGRTAGVEWVTPFAGTSVQIANTGTITLNAAKVINNGLEIASGATLNLGTFTTSTAHSLRLAGVNQVTGTWGGTGSGATNINTTFFAANSGRITIGTAATIASTGAGGNWSDPNTWSTGIIPNTADNVTIATGATVTVDITDAVCSTLAIGNGNGTATLTFTASGSPLLTVSGAVTVGNNGNSNRVGVITFASGSTLIAGSLIHGATGTQASTITMTAGGTLKLNGAITVSSTGSVWTPGAGTLVMNATNTLPATIFTSFNNLQIDAGTTTLGVSVNSTAAGTIYVKAGATLALGTLSYGATTAPASVTLECGSSGSTISGSSGTLTLGGPVAVNVASGTGTGATISCPVALTNAQTRVFTVADETTSATDLTISGLISTSGALTKSGAGTMVLSGQNTFSGLTTISLGILKLGATGGATNSPLGTIGAGTVVSGVGAALDLGGFNIATAEALTLNNTGVASGGALTNSSGTASTFAGLIALGSSSSIVASSGNIILSAAGTISGSGFGLTLDGTATGCSLASIVGTGAGTITKAGTGTWTLSGSSTYTGLTTINAGILKLGATGGVANTPLGTIGAGTVVSATGAALDLNGNTLGTTEGLTLNGTGVSNGGALMNSGAACNYSGLIALGSSSSIVGGTGTINVSNAGTIAGATFDLTLGGAQGGTLASILGTTSGALTKADAGTWTVSGVNTYTGKTTISAGTLSVNSIQNVSGGNSALGAPTTIPNGTIDIGATGILKYTGTGHTSDRVMNLTASGGTIDASGASGTLTLTGGVTGTATNLTLTGTGLAIESGVIATTSGTVTKSLAGTWTLSGDNTYTGLTTISAGILKLGANGGATNTPLGTTGAGTVVSATGAALDLAGFTLGTSEALSLSGTGVSTNGALTNSSGTSATYSGLITLTAASTIGAPAGDIILSNAGTITGATFGLTLSGTATGCSLASIIGTTSGTLTKSGNGTWSISGLNTYSGATTISTGTLKIGLTGGSIPDASVVTVSGTLDLNGNNETISALAGASTGIVTSGVAGSVAITTNGSTTTTYSGIIQNGSGTVGLTRSGSGTLILSGNNTYTGATIIGGTGTIQLGVTNAIPDASAITLSGGTFSNGSAAGLAETIGTINFNAAASTIALGTGTATLTIANSTSLSPWTGGTTLTITGWTGTGFGSSFTASANKIVVGVGGLTTAQLNKITFLGFSAGAEITASGECVPRITTYYSEGNLAPQTLTNWNSNRDGTSGSTPASFVSGVFVIQGTPNVVTPHSMTTSGSWSVSGDGSGVIIENGATLTASNQVSLSSTSTFQVDNGGTYVHNNASAIAVFGGTESFGASSNVRLDAWVNNTTVITTGVTLPFGNLEVNTTALTGNWNQIWTGAFTLCAGNFKLTSSGSGEFRLTSSGAPTITIGGNYTQTANIVNFAVTSGATILEVAGNFSFTGGTITEGGTGSGTIRFNGTGTPVQTFTSGGTLSQTINFAIISPAAVNFGTSIISNGSIGTFTLNSGAKIITANSAGISSSVNTGTIQCTGKSYSSGASYEFQGSNTGVFTLSTPLTITGTLSFNRANGVTLDQSFTATTLGLISGPVITGANSITIPSGGTYTQTGNTEYVSGSLKRVYSSATSLVFPVGKFNSPTHIYRPLTFQYTALTGTSTVTVIQTESALTGTLPVSTNLNNSRTWDISQTGGSAFTYFVTLDSTGDTRTGTEVMLKKELGSISSNLTTTPAVTNASGFTTYTGTVNFTTGSTCTNAPNAGTDQIFAPTCGLTSVTLGATAPTFGTGLWSIIAPNPGGGSITTPSSTTSNFSGTAGSTYKLKWEISNGNCVNSDTMSVTFNRNPSTAAAGPDQTGSSTCGLTATALAATAPTIGTGQWSIFSGAGGSFSGGSGNPTNSSSATATFIGTAGTAYVLVWTTSNSPCVSSSDTVNITFNINPTTAAAGPDQTGSSTCGLTSVTLGATPASIGTGQWSIVSGSGGSFSTGSGNPTNSNLATATFNGTAGTTYLLRWATTNGSCTSADTMTVTFNENPTTASAGPDQTGLSTCGLTTVTLAATAPTIGTGQWTIIAPNPGGGSFVDGTDATTNFSGNAGAAYTLVWTTSNSPCNDSKDTMLVTFNLAPTIADAGPDQTGSSTCGLTNVTLSANAPSIGTGQWTIVAPDPGGGFFSNDASESSTFTGTSGNTYTLVWTISNAPCNASTDTVIVTFNLSPTTSNAGANTSFCGGSFIVLSANAPTGLETGEWSILGGQSPNLSQFSSITNPTATFTEDGGLGNYDLQWTLTLGSCTSSSSVTVTAIAGPWIGGVSDVWTEPANWCGGVPTATTDVTIPAGATFYPVITTGSQVAQSITIDAGGSLTIDGGDLTGGDIENNGTVTIGVGGTLDMISNQISGTGDVIINGTFVTSKAAGLSGTSSTAVKNTVNSLVIGAASTIDYTATGGSQNISAVNYANLSNSGNGNRTFANGTIGISGTFSTGSGNYTIGSSTVEFNGTSAQSIPSPSVASGANYNSLTINNSSGASLSANVSIKDALDLVDGAFDVNGQTFTLLSTASQTARIAPVTGGSIIGDVTMQRFAPGPLSGWATIGMPVGGATLNEWNDDIATSGYVGSTYGTGTFVSVYTYDETIGGTSDADSAYIAPTNVTNSVDPKAGYFVYLADFGSSVGDKTIDVTGPPLIGDQNMNVTFTSKAGVDDDGWNLINNPYCSSIDWTAPDWIKTNMDDAIYVYNTDSGQYMGYVSGAGFNGGNEIVASSQAFFVHANAASPVLTAKETIKDPTSPAFYKTTASTTTAAGFLRLKLVGLGGTYHDEAIFRTKTGASNNFDPAYDAYKLYSFDYAAPNICTKVNGLEYAVNSIDELTDNLDLPVRVNINTPGSYTINFKGLTNFSNISCFNFEDKLTNTVINLHVDSVYTFTSAIDTVKSYNRFVLHFGVDPLVASAIPSSTVITLPGNDTVNFTNASTGASYYSWDFGDGSPIVTASNPSHAFSTAGTYIVTLTAGNYSGCVGPQTTTFQIIVNDVTGIHNLVSSENIEISKDINGVYANYNFKNNTIAKFTIYTALGQKVADTQIESLQNKGRVLISAPTLAKGVYTVEALFEDKRIFRKIEF